MWLKINMIEIQLIENYENISFDIENIIYLYLFPGLSYNVLYKEIYSQSSKARLFQCCDILMRSIGQSSLQKV